MSCEEFWTLSVHLLSVRPRTSPVDPYSDTLHWLYRISSVYHQLSAIIMLSFVSLQSSQTLHPLQIKGSKTKWKGYILWREVSFEGEQLFCYVSAYGFWHDKGMAFGGSVIVAFGGECPYKGGDIVIHTNLKMLNFYNIGHFL
jgi:hypothetical protein